MIIILEKQAFNELRKINEIDKKKIKNKILFLESFPDKNNLDIKKLKTPFDWFRLRVGNYRILFVLSKWKIVIYAVNHRKDAYKI